MLLIGARMIRVEPGLVQIELPHRDDLTQQHGFFHGGFVSAIADSAGGYAAFTLFPADASVLTVEYKINLLAPAQGERLIATGRVLKAGRTLSICELAVDAVTDSRSIPCARGLQTIMCLDGRSDRPA
ncbi:MAG TPA: PaaI family thioesterase [Candidatus Cybelea sp.]|nr:PaaI family thioesterase [Candidatus Cybelea sp.]